MPDNPIGTRELTLAGLDEWPAPFSSSDASLLPSVNRDHQEEEQLIGSQLSQELICFPILRISPRSHACAASVFTLGCQIIRYLKPVISAGAFISLILRLPNSSVANRFGAVRISFVPGIHLVAAPKYGSVMT